MSVSRACLNASVALADIHSLKMDFDTALQTAITSGSSADIASAENLKLRLEAAVANLQKFIQETLASREAEHLFELRRRYNDQIKLLKKAKLIESRKDKDSLGVEREVHFMTGIDGKDYPLPSYEVIAQSILERKELFEMKADQGFKKLLLVPFGMSLDVLIEKFRAYIYASKDRINAELFFNKDEPFYVWNKYNGADVSGALVYDPKEFSSTNHGGETKRKILYKQAASMDPSSGWRVLFIQEGQEGYGGRGVRYVPKEDNGKVVGHKYPRPDIEAGKSAKEYLNQQLASVSDQDSPYYGERGMAPEEEILAFMIHLEETGEFMDDPEDSVASIDFLTGVYLPSADSIPFAYWDRTRLQILLLGRSPDEVEFSSGTRSAVRVFSDAF